MWEAAATILIGVVVIIFIILILRPKMAEKRHDDRDARKSSDMDEPGGWTEETQQPAELQVGQEGERVDRSRFEPDSTER